MEHVDNNHVSFSVIQNWDEMDTASLSYYYCRANAYNLRSDSISGGAKCSYNSNGLHTAASVRLTSVRVETKGNLTKSERPFRAYNFLFVYTMG